MLVLAQECFWWLKMEDACQALVCGCQCCKVFEGVVVKALLSPIQAYAPLEVVHVNFTCIEATMELNQPLDIKNVLVITNHFTSHFIETFDLFILRVHDGIVSCETVRAPTGNLLITSGLSTHA